MRIARKEDNKVVVRVIKATKGKDDDRVSYETVDSFDIQDAKPEEVVAFLEKAFAAEEARTAKK